MVSIRSYQDNDRVKVLNLWRETLFSVFQNDPNITETTVENISDTYLTGKGDFLIANDGDLVVGTIAYILENGFPRIKRMYVDRDYQGKGVGEKLLLKLLEGIKQKGYSKVSLSTYPEMTRAIRFYLKHGFKEYARDKEQIYLEKIL